ncbi:MAG: hypothetical protein AB7Q17_02930 [Phycisphaerae bacterium]
MFACRFRSVATLALLAFAAAGAFAQPTNDTCAAAAALSDQIVLLASESGNAGAGTESTASCGGGGVNDVWYSYLATANGTVTIDTCGSAFDTILAAFAACGGAELACDDDSGCGTTSRITFNVTQNTTYFIRVASKTGTTGRVVIGATTLTPGAGLANDECANAAAVAEGSFVGTLVGATTDNVATCVTPASGGDVWYRLTPAVNGTATANTVGSDANIDTVISVLSACDGNEIVCNDDMNAIDLTSAVEWAVTAGNSYFIRVAGAALSPRGVVGLNVTVRDGGGNGNDNGGGNANDNGGGNTNANDNGSGGTGDNANDNSGGGDGNANDNGGTGDNANDNGGGGTGDNANDNGGAGDNANDNGSGNDNNDELQCGAAMCGPGAAMMMPFMLLGIGAMKLSLRRQRRR